MPSDKKRKHCQCFSASSKQKVENCQGGRALLAVGREKYFGLNNKYKQAINQVVNFRGMM
jgi:hypothetical protein